MKRKEQVQSFLVASAMWLNIGIAVLLLLLSFFNFGKLETIAAGYQAISRYTQRLISIIVLIFSIQLFKRKRIAWLGIVILISISLFVHFALHHNYFSTAIIISEMYILGVLLVYHTYFNRKGQRLSVKHSLALVALLLAVVIINAVLEISALHAAGQTDLTLWQSMGKLGNVLLGGETDSKTHQVFEQFLLFFFWATVIGGLLLILRSASIGRTATQADKAKARQLVKQHGQNPGSYLTLEDDKMLFFGEVTSGVVAYGIVGDVVVVNGDPICSPDDFDGLLTEFKLFYTNSGYQCIFLSTTAAFLEKYTAHGFQHVKCGEEARFNLNELTLAGGKVAKLRANINHANKAGLVTSEYAVSTQRDEAVEKEIAAVSSAWLSEKKSSQLAFTVGGVGLENPLDRRYFYLRNPEGKMVAFNVYLPFAGMDGYMADVTRRTPDAPGGATEKLIYDAFAQFKEEGCHWGSMGLAPLSNVHEEGVQDSATVKLLELIYQKFNAFYGFKDLRLAKERYSPTSWEPGYFVYSTPTITPQMAYAIVKIQNPAGIGDYLKGLFKKDK